MNFVHKYWITFCKELHENGLHSIPAKEVTGVTADYLVLKHDVETNVPRAYAMAEIEHRYGHRGSYYVQAYLLNEQKNIELLRKMQAMGHEISYHYDVMDSCKGNLEKAIAEFDKNRQGFEKCGFMLKTVCQHGNPVVERVGYTSNRDFFRSADVQALYSEISDIMVNFKETHETDYVYYSDAGRQFHMIYDPLYNDITNSDDKNIAYADLMELQESVLSGGSHIISVHPHRWSPSELQYSVQALLFKTIRRTAKLLIRIPGMKKIMGKFYFLAKKI